MSVEIPLNLVNTMDELTEISKLSFHVKHPNKEVKYEPQFFILFPFQEELNKQWC